MINNNKRRVGYSRPTLNIRSLRASAKAIQTTISTRLRPPSRRTRLRRHLCMFRELQALTLRVLDMARDLSTLDLLIHNISSNMPRMGSVVPRTTISLSARTQLRHNTTPSLLVCIRTCTVHTRFLINMLASPLLTALIPSLLHLLIPYTLPATSRKAGTRRLCRTHLCFLTSTRAFLEALLVLLGVLDEAGVQAFTETGIRLARGNVPTAWVVTAVLELQARRI